jgi:hypothetical protein
MPYPRGSVADPFVDSQVSSEIHRRFIALCCHETRFGKPRKSNTGGYTDTEHDEHSDAKEKSGDTVIERCLPVFMRRVADLMAVLDFPRVTEANRLP